MTDLERFIIARWAYAVGEDFIGDIEYNELEKKMKVEFPDNEYCKRSWSDDPCPIDLLDKYGLTRMKKVIKLSYNSESIPAITTMAELESYFGSLNKKSRLSFKIDGWNTETNYYNGSYISGNTRGRTGNQQEANVLRDVVPAKVPFKGRVMVTGEGNIPNDKWELFQLRYSNTAQRNSVSTVIATGESEYLTVLAFNIDVEGGLPEGTDKYKLLNELGFKTPSFVWVHDWKSLLKGIEIMSARSKFYNYLTDGLVIENEDIQMAIRLGAWSEEVFKSYVVGYEERQGMYGKSMVVRVEPVMVRGNKREYVNITNVANIIDNDLRIGYPIAFTVRSSAISVIDVGNTRRLQKEWAGRYEDYKEIIKKQGEIK